MVDPLEIYWGLSETLDILSFLFSHEMLTSKTAVWKHHENILILKSLAINL